ncbi:hypothetical protein KKE19_00935 [Patescibacteria group bacterium]|nr:hypothetical protein [Patescibacteria group bacterium]MBU4274359.1 hypothetical protein [Patescibacteria group bacterium]MBU4367533.1 hypothetical protein [Patescibacteria group bacterium]MBU4461574.1 hypothetical protein [Patescibacteria group bacterium]MCG2699471.1 hypothetical protein [Candidatus Parcubacteria bacterium]
MQHRNNKIGQSLSVKIDNGKPLTINPIMDMLYKYFTIEKRNGLAAQLKTKVKKENIAKQLRKSRMTI